MTRFHILGSGAVGSLLTRYLRHYGHDVTLIMRSSRNLDLFKQANYKITFEKEGITEEIDNVSVEISQRKKERSIYYVDHSNNPSSPIHSLFVATKAHQVLEALEPLRSRLSRESTIVLMQNGIGTYEEVTKCYFPDKNTRPSFVIAVNSHGAYRKPVEEGSYHIVQNGVGSFVVGIVPRNNWIEEKVVVIGDKASTSENTSSFPQMTDPSSAPLTSTDISSSLHCDPAQSDPRSSLSKTISAILAMSSFKTTLLPWETLYVRQLEKLVINATINPLTALIWCTNGELTEKQQSYDITSRICTEASNSILGSGILDRLSQPADTAEPLRARFHPLRLQKSVMDVCWATSQNRSSMLQDMSRGEATEIDYINGYIVKLGKIAGVPTPVNETMVDLIKLKHRINTAKWPSNRERETG